MSDRDFVSAAQLLPEVLRKLAAESGRTPGWNVIWRSAMGPYIAMNATPLCLRDGCLEVQVTHARWAHELQSREPEILQRLEEAFGARIVQRLMFVI